MDGMTPWVVMLTKEASAREPIAELSCYANTTAVVMSNEVRHPPVSR